jgi:hypothetical protein
MTGASLTLGDLQRQQSFLDGDLLTDRLRASTGDHVRR